MNLRWSSEVSGANVGSDMLVTSIPVGPFAEPDWIQHPQVPSDLLVGQGLVCVQLRLQLKAENVSIVIQRGRLRALPRC